MNRFLNVVATALVFGVVSSAWAEPVGSYDNNSEVGGVEQALCNDEGRVAVANEIANAGAYDPAAQATVEESLNAADHAIEVLNSGQTCGEAAEEGNEGFDRLCFVRCPRR